METLVRSNQRALSGSGRLRPGVPSAYGPVLSSMYSAIRCSPPTEPLRPWHASRSWHWVPGDAGEQVLVAIPGHVSECP